MILMNSNFNPSYLKLNTNGVKTLILETSAVGTYPVIKRIIGSRKQQNMLITLGLLTKFLSR